MRSLDLISVVDLLIASTTLIEYLMPMDRLRDVTVKSMDSGPRLRGFKARLCYFLSG